MYIGIKYEQRLKSVNKQLNCLGSALILHGKTRYYFKNPIVALKVAKALNSINKNLKYSLYELEKEKVGDLVLIRTYTEFENYRNEKIGVENTL